jgi:hypothetical protein
MSYGSLRAAILLATGLAANAQTPRLMGPVLGYVHDSQQKTIRPILGTPGAGTMGDALAGTGDILSATIAQRRGYALAAVDGQGELTLLSLGEPVTPRTLPVPAKTSLLALSPDQRSAAAIGAGERRLYVMTGLPEDPVVSWTADLTDELQAVAIADGGETVLGSFSTSVVLFTSAGSSLVRDGQGASSIAFVPGSRDAFAAGPELWLIRDAGAAWQPIEGETAPSPQRVSVTPQGREVIVAGNEEIIVIALEDLGSRRIQCPCAPDVLELQQPGSLFRLTRLDSGPLWFIDAGEKELRLWFVPVPLAQ